MELESVYGRSRHLSIYAHTRTRARAREKLSRFASDGRIFSFETCHFFLTFFLSGSVSRVTNIRFVRLAISRERDSMKTRVPVVRDKTRSFLPALCLNSSSYFRWENALKKYRFETGICTTFTTQSLNGRKDSRGRRILFSPFSFSFLATLKFVGFCPVDDRNVYIYKKKKDFDLPMNPFYFSFSGKFLSSFFLFSNACA